MENWAATKCHVASFLAPTVPNPHTDDRPGMALEVDSEDERVPNHLISVPYKEGPYQDRPPLCPFRL